MVFNDPSEKQVYLKLKRIVLDKLKEGFSKEEIKKEALKAHWPIEIVNTVMIDIGNKFKEDKYVLSEAINDIDKELEELKLEKTRLESDLMNKEEKLLNTQKEEIDHRKKVAMLISQEKNLSNEKEKLREDLLLIKQKLDKVERISRELKSV